MFNQNFLTFRLVVTTVCMAWAGQTLAESETVDLTPTWQSEIIVLAPGLPRNHGLVLVDTHIERKVSAWALGKTLPSVTPPLGRHLQVISLPKGKYHWQSISIPLFNLPHQRSLKSDSRWSFTVEPKKLNYFGSLFVGKNRASDAVDVRLVNRSAEILKLLEENQADLLKQLPLAYTGNSRDDFFTLLRPTPSNAIR